MVRPNFTVPKFSKPKLSIRIIAIVVLILAGAVLAFSWGAQNPNSSIGKLVQKAGRTVGLQIGESLGGESDQNTPVAPVAGKESTLAMASVDQILQLLNNWRMSQGFPAIVKNDRFCEFAEVRAKQVSQNWSQTTITENKDYYFRAVCLKCKHIAEVLAREVGDAQELINRWTANPATRETLSKPYNIGCIGGYTPNQVETFIALEMGERVE